MHELAQDVVGAGELDPSDVEWFVATAHEAARAGLFTMTLTMHAIVGTRS